MEKQIAYVNLIKGEAFDRLCGETEYKVIKDLEAAGQLQIFIDGRNPINWKKQH